MINYIDTCFKIFVFGIIPLFSISCYNENKPKNIFKKGIVKTNAITKDTIKPKKKTKEGLPTLEKLKSEYLGVTFVSNQKKFKDLVKKAEEHLETKFDETTFLMYLQEEFYPPEDSLDNYVSKLSKQELNDTLYYLMGTTPYMLGTGNLDDYGIIFRKSIRFGIQKNIYRAFSVYAEHIFQYVDAFLEEKDRKKRSKQYLLYALSSGDTEAIIVFLDYWNLRTNRKMDETFAIKWLEYAANLNDKWACGRLAKYYEGGKIFETQTNFDKNERKYLFYKSKFDDFDLVGKYLQLYEKEKDISQKFEYILKAYFIQRKIPYLFSRYDYSSYIQEMLGVGGEYSQLFQNYLKKNNLVLEDNRFWGKLLKK